MVKANEYFPNGVAPFAGARIEITALGDDIAIIGVAPFAGARIEINGKWQKKVCVMSLPSRERGLKLYVISNHANWLNVAPFAGARIEIRRKPWKHLVRHCRSLRGSAD